MRRYAVTAIWNSIYAVSLLAVAGALTTWLLPILAHVPCPPDVKDASSCSEAWLYRYQTLLGGLLALAGAIGTVWMVGRQIRQAEDQDERRRNRESYAARAVLPLALSTTCDYAFRCARILVPLDASDPTTFEAFTPPELPSNLVEPLRECIRYSDRSQAKQLADLLSWMQVQHSRLRGLGSEFGRDMMVTNHSVDSCLIDAAELYSMASKLFDYGRRAEEGKLAREPTDDTRTALRLMRVYEEDRESVYKLLIARAGQRV